MIRFKTLDEVYILPYSKFEFYWERYIQEIKNRLLLKKFGKMVTIFYQYQPRLDYLKAVDKLILDESEDRV